VSTPDPEEPVPRLPRPKGWGFSGGELVRIAMFATLLVAVLVLRKPCASNVGNFIQSFEAPVDAGAATLPPAPPGTEYVHCSVDESPAACAARIKEVQDRLDATEPGGSGKASAPGSPPAAPDRSPR
jgi:hypothetical protein